MPGPVGESAILLCAALLLLGGTARAADELTPDELASYRRLSRPRGAYARLFATTSFGAGLRFNNPYRLRSQLGDTEQSLSLTAPYFDLGVGLGFGDPFGWQHGPSLHLAIATEGVAQQALSASYMLLYRGSSPWLGYARAGASILTAPDANVGGELAVGGALFFSAALGLTAELVGDLYYGAATYGSELTTYPILSLQGGLIVDLEVLP